MCARYCGVAPSTPGRLGYGDDSGREIQETQKPAHQNFGRRGQKSLSYGLIISDKSLEMRKNCLQSTPSENTCDYIYRLAIHGD
jgi:hypothetical protein